MQILGFGVLWKGYYQNSCYWISEVLANPSRHSFAKLERHQIIENMMASIELLHENLNNSRLITL